MEKDQPEQTRHQSNYMDRSGNIDALVIVVMFMRPPAEAKAEETPAPAAFLTRVVLAVSIVGILVLGVYPNWFQDVASKGHPAIGPASIHGMQQVMERIGTR